MQTERMVQIQERIRKVMSDAEARYGVDLSGVQVRFDLRGRAAGMAGYKGLLFSKHRDYFLRFNRDMIHNDGFKHVLEDTVPHEIAHIVCYMRPELGSKHDSGWKRVCRSLGGNGERCHTEQVVYAKGNTYQYKTTHGRLVSVSETIHRNIQMGAIYGVKRGGGKLNQQCEWSLFRPGMVQQAAAPAAPKAAPAAPSVPKAAAPAGMSKAEAVRAAIRQAKARGDGQAVVIEAVIQLLAMPRSMAKKYVTENWSRT
jgi:SprT protein